MIPGIIITPLARDELTGPRGEGYRRMIEACPAGRPGTPDEVGTIGELLMSRAGAFISGSDILLDRGVTATYWYGQPTPTTTSDSPRGRHSAQLLLRKPAADVGPRRSFASD